jgi:serine/threonine protein kinase
MSNLLGQSLGRYHILEQLGEGGMATVYKAYDTRLETDVAVKIIRTEEFSPKILERVLLRFEREAKSLARLTHPNIVKVMDYGDYEGLPYLVMPYLPGGTLKERLKQGPLAWQDTVRLLLPIVEALEYAHEHNIIHRDIKPSNILLTEKGQPTLTDFGIAKILETEEAFTLTGTGIGVGTPEYMAPEQWTGAATAQSDIYSLGIVLYEMITGRKPYVADTPAAILLKQANDPLPRPRDFAGNLPDQVEQVILKCLAKNGQDRYSSAADLKRALTSLIERLPALVIPEQDTTLNEVVLPEPSIEATIETAPAGAEKLGAWNYAVIVLVVVAIVGGIGGLLWYGWSKLSAPTAPATLTTTLTAPLTATRRPVNTQNYEATRQENNARVAATATSLPAWVTDFSEPILAEVSKYPPTINDDFQDNSGGWYEPYGCDRDSKMSFVDGELIFGCELSRSNMAYKDFVLEFDTHFVQGKGNTGQLRIVYRNAYEFLLDSNGNITLFMTDWYKKRDFNYFPPSKAFGDYKTNHMLIIARGNRYAFYVNGIPVHYLEDVYYFTSEPIRFNIFDGGNTAVALDNLKIWDLEKIPNLP